MSREEWLKGLKPGDPVVKRKPGYYGGTPVYEFQSREVARVLKTVIVLDDGSRFRRDDGWSRKLRAELMTHADPQLVKLMKQAREVRRRVDVAAIKRNLAMYQLNDDEAGKVLDFVVALLQERPEGEK